MTDQTSTPDLARDDEVTLTITGRVVYMTDTGRLVVEYIKANGFPDRVAVDTTAATVGLNLLPQPDEAEKDHRRNAHLMIAQSALDAEIREQAYADVPYREQVSG